MTLLNSNLILAKNIKLDKQYRNVINYTESNLLTLVRNNKVIESNNYSFIEHGKNSLNVEVSYYEALKANYMAFRNSDYSNKWFFAFVDSIEFISPKACKINYTVDVWNTWFNDLTLKNCFVIREHVANDTLGLHTIPEGLETGEYKTQAILLDGVNNDLTTILATTEDFLDSYNINVHTYSGIPTPLTYYRYDTLSALQSALQGLQAGKADTIVSVFVAPKWLTSFQGTTVKVANSSSPQTSDLGISRISTLDGYTPKNKKLLCWPYCYIGLSNGCGQYNVYHQEDWSLSSNEMKLRLYGTLNIGCSIRAVPLNYLGSEYAWEEGITLGKFPTLAWPNDVYTNWLTQNGVNLGIAEINAYQTSMLGSLAVAGAGVATGNALLLGSGVIGALGAMQENYRQDMIPIGVKGSVNAGDVISASGQNRLHAYRVTIKNEYAQILDQFMTKYGYKVTTVKTPNITSRTYWNFIQIGEGEVIGFGEVPADALELINAICRNGVTVWHDHANIGNYSLNNTIVS